MTKMQALHILHRASAAMASAMITYFSNKGNPAEFNSFELLYMIALLMVKHTKRELRIASDRLMKLWRNTDNPQMMVK